MKIAQIAPLQYSVPPVHEGGTERVIAWLCDALTALGHDVTLFAAQGSSTTARLAAQGMPASCTGGNAGTRAVEEAAMLAMVARDADKFDVLHCHTEYYHAAVLAPFNDRLFTTLHWRTDEPDRQQLFHHFPSLRCICISESQQRCVPLSNRSGVIHHGLPADAWCPGDGNGGYLAFLGRLTDQKRPDLAIEVARRANTPLKLAGNVDLGNPDYFTRAIAPLLGAPIEFVGEVDDVGKVPFLGDALALLMPLDWPEPFGLVTIEAMACGTPVIAWDRGSMRELISEGVNGYLVGSVTEALDAVERCKSLSRRRVRHHFETHFSSETMARNHLQLYGE